MENLIKTNYIMVSGGECKECCFYKYEELCLKSTTVLGECKVLNKNKGIFRKVKNDKRIN